jgi:hypothetical protein
MYQPKYAMTVDHAQAALEDGLRAIGTGQTQFDLSEVTSVDSSSVSPIINGFSRLAQCQRAIVFQSGAVVPIEYRFIAFLSRAHREFIADFATWLQYKSPTFRKTIALCVRWMASR